MSVSVTDFPYHMKQNLRSWAFRSVERFHQAKIIFFCTFQIKYDRVLHKEGYSCVPPHYRTHTHHMSDKVFLSHIGGLRGIAILLVILFHLCPSLFPNCYYGVDIFLIITGYLLFLGANRNDGTWKAAGTFAIKKAQRILPSLSVAVLLTVLAGIYFLDKTLLEATARLGRYALFGMPNNHLNKVVADYFDTTAAQNPLLHTWYIGVTLQVYLLFAAGSMVCKRISRKAVIIGLTGIAICSLAWKYRVEIQGMLAACGVMGQLESVNPPTHYETLPRLWEVLAGGLVILMPQINSKWVRSLLLLLGLACISTAFYLAHAEPIVVLGTLLIVAYAGNCHLSWLISNKVLLGIGAVSFSLYLVHMPVFAFYKSWIVVPPTFGEYAAMLGITGILGILFWRFVETHRFNWKTWVALWCICMLLCVLAKKTSVISDWIANENESSIIKSYPDWQLVENEDLYRGFDTEQLNYWGGWFGMADTKAPKELRKPALFLMGDATKTPDYVMMGDSHAGSMYPGFDAMGRKHGCAGIYIPTIISPFWNYEVQRDPSYYCTRDKIQALITWLKEQPQLKYIVVIQRWYQRCRVNKFDWDKKLADLSIEAHTNGLRDFLKNMQAIGKTVILVDQIPDFETNPRTYGKWCIRHGRAMEERITPFICSKERYHKRHQDYLDMLDTVEKEGLCHVLSFDRATNTEGDYISYANGEVLYRDDNHPAAPGAIYLMEKLAPDFLPLISDHQ